jgi:predicted 3-demethylubiquinone-9 3-methyltransferase (glyoxalase superfamily)
MKLEKITPCLWFNGQAEEAVGFYMSVFKNSSVLLTSYYTEAGKEIHKQKPGSVLTIEFRIEGQGFLALNGGPEFKFSEAISLIVHCDTQEEIDYYWGKLREEGDPAAQQCGWLKDKFGVSWQVVPNGINEMIASEEKERVERVMDAMMKMKKLDKAELEKAFGKLESIASSPDEVKPF